MDPSKRQAIEDFINTIIERHGTPEKRAKVRQVMSKVEPIELVAMLFGALYADGWSPAAAAKFTAKFGLDPEEVETAMEMARPYFSR